MTKFAQYFFLALISLFATTSVALAGAKHMGSGIVLPSEYLAASPWFLVGGVLLISIIAFRLLRSRSS